MECLAAKSRIASGARVHLASILASPYAAVRESLFAAALAESRAAVLEASVDLVLEGFSDEGWLAEQIAKELGSVAPELLLRRAPAVGLPADPERVAAAVRYIFRFADADAARLCARSLASTDASTAFVAACAAGTLSPSSATPAPLLAQLGAPAPTAALEHLASRPEPALRRATAQALALAPSAEALPILEQLAADAEPEVRSACYWSARTLSLIDPTASRLLALSFHVEDEPSLRAMLDGLLPTAPMPPVLIRELIRAVGSITEPTLPGALRALAERASEIPDADLLALTDLACALFVVWCLSGSPELDRRLRGVTSILRRPSLGLWELRDPRRAWDAFVTGAFLAIARSDGNDPLVLDCETAGILGLVHDQAFLTPDMSARVEELAGMPPSQERLEELAAVLGSPDAAAASHLALVVLVARGELFGPEQRYGAEGLTGFPLHLRLRAMGPIWGPRRAFETALSGRAGLPGIEGLAACLALAHLRAPRALANLQSRLLKGEADGYDLFLLGASLLMSIDERDEFLALLRASGRDTSDDPGAALGTAPRLSQARRVELATWRAAC